MARINSPAFGRSHLGVVTPALSMEQQMLLRTLREKARPMSAYELTNHWMPTWSLQEVNKYLQDLVQSGHVQFHGRETRLYSVVNHKSQANASTS